MSIEIITTIKKRKTIFICYIKLQIKKNLLFV